MKHIKLYMKTKERKQKLFQPLSVWGKTGRKVGSVSFNLTGNNLQYQESF